jgi:hypothetical protein
MIMYFYFRIGYNLWLQEHWPEPASAFSNLAIAER